MKELKDCPFCGEPAEIREWRNYPSLYRVGCKNQDSPHYLDRWDETEAEAIESWNTRAQNGEDLQRLAHELNDDNLRLSNLVTKFDTALRTIATEAGMEEAFAGIDCDPDCKPLVDRVKELKKLKEMADIYISDFFKEANTCDGCRWWLFPSDWTGAQYGDCSYQDRLFPTVSNVTHCGPKFGCIHWEEKK